MSIENSDRLLANGETIANDQTRQYYHDFFDENPPKLVFLITTLEEWQQNAEDELATEDRALGFPDGFAEMEPDARENEPISLNMEKIKNFRVSVIDEFDNQHIGMEMALGLWLQHYGGLRGLLKQDLPCISPVFAVLSFASAVFERSSIKTNLTRGLIAESHCKILARLLYRNKILIDNEDQRVVLIRNILRQKASDLAFLIGILKRHHWWASLKWASSYPYCNPVITHRQPITEDRFYWLMHLCRRIIDTNVSEPTIFFIERRERYNKKRYILCNSYHQAFFTSQQCRQAKKNKSAVRRPLIIPTPIPQNLWHPEKELGPPPIVKVPRLPVQITELMIFPVGLQEFIMRKKMLRTINITPADAVCDFNKFTSKNECTLKDAEVKSEETLPVDESISTDNASVEAMSKIENSESIVSCNNSENYKSPKEILLKKGDINMNSFSNYQVKLSCIDLSDIKEESIHLKDEFDNQVLDLSLFDREAALTTKTSPIFPKDEETIKTAIPTARASSKRPHTPDEESSSKRPRLQAFEETLSNVKSTAVNDHSIAINAENQSHNLMNCHNAAQGSEKLVESSAFKPVGKPLLNQISLYEESANFQTLLQQYHAAFHARHHSFKQMTYVQQQAVWNQNNFSNSSFGPRNGSYGQVPAINFKLNNNVNSSFVQPVQKEVSSFGACAVSSPSGAKELYLSNHTKVPHMTRNATAVSLEFSNLSMVLPSQYAPISVNRPLRVLPPGMSPNFLP